MEWDQRTKMLRPDSQFDWKTPEPFTARLRFHTVIKVRSGATVRMRNEDTGSIYPMRLDDFAELIPNMTLGATPVWVWVPYKSGQNYNIRRVLPA